ncbi:hypothetical protein COV82_02910 [Candidatus Peregrinibacteria bacterium CG11_big_fil_rev_8_21_14_0_20_46_8]|nr:MAG: hypothetical protein COV82_02910 [Candidatus Peregrinibacteria bacterium CG11_big_fil_rev_8_21_14_0_20_46_8]
MSAEKPIRSYDITSLEMVKNTPQGVTYESFRGWYEELQRFDGGAFARELNSMLAKKGGDIDLDDYGTNAFLYRAYLLFCHDIYDWWLKLEPSRQNDIRKNVGIPEDQEINLYDPDVLTKLMRRHYRIPGRQFKSFVIDALDAVQNCRETPPSVRLSAVVFEGIERELMEAGFTGPDLIRAAAHATAEFFITAGGSLAPIDTQASDVVDARKFLTRESLQSCLRNQTPYKDLAKGCLPTQSEVAKATAQVRPRDLTRLIYFLRWKGSHERIQSSTGIRASDLKALEQQVEHLEAAVITRVGDLILTVDHSKPGIPYGAVSSIILNEIELPAINTLAKPAEAKKELSKVKFEEIEREVQSTWQKIWGGVTDGFKAVFGGSRENAAAMLGAAAGSAAQEAAESRAKKLAQKKSSRRK